MKDILHWNSAVALKAGELVVAARCLEPEYRDMVKALFGFLDSIISNNALVSIYECEKWEIRLVFYLEKRTKAEISDKDQRLDRST